MMEKQMITNANALQQYMDLLGDAGPEFIIDIITTLLLESSKNFKLLDQGLSENDFVSFRRIAHTLKTSCLTVGAEALAARFLTLEEAGRGGNLSSAGEILDQCKIDFQSLTDELEQMKTNLAT